MEFTKKQSIAIEKAFNDKVVQDMNPEEYSEYIQQIACLSISTMIANKGAEFTKEFVEAGLNNTEPTCVVTQQKLH